RPVAELVGEVGNARHGRREQHAAEQGEDEVPAVGPDVAEQPPVGLPRRGDRALTVRALAAAARRVVHGLPAGSSVTVAMLTSAKPRRPSTSMAVITDWWVARASARSVTRTLRLVPVSLRSAARSVSGLELMSSCPLTR